MIVCGRVRGNVPPSPVSTSQRTGNAAASLSVSMLCSSSSRAGRRRSLLEAVERLVARGPNIDMSPDEELRARSEALQEAVLASAAAGLDELHVEHLRDVIGRRWNAFRRGLRRGDQPALVEPLPVTLNPGARSIKARPRVYNHVNTACLAACMLRWRL